MTESNLAVTIEFLLKAFAMLESRIKQKVTPPYIMIPLTRKYPSTFLIIEDIMYIWVVVLDMLRELER